MTKLSIQPLSGAMGAELRGVDLSRPLEESDRCSIGAALDRYLAIFFPDQRLAPRALSYFLSSFGELDRHPYLPAIGDDPYIHELRKTPAEATNYGGVWHTDATFLERPIMLNSLYARELPLHGGDTLFIDLIAAYDRLSTGLKTMLERLRLHHVVVPKYAEDVGVATNGTADVQRLEALHPVVRVQERTGRKGLYIGGVFADRFEGWTQEESRPLIDYLLAHVQRPEFQMRYRWRRDDFGIWDNRYTMHYALNDYPGETRVMHRGLVREPSLPA